jgi:sugar-specific transcriptional regulator TrmB
MRKTTRKGIKIGIPHLVEGWYEEIIEELKEDVKKRSGRNLLRRSKTREDVAERFREFLTIEEKNIEAQLWYGISFSIRNELGKEIDFDLHQMFGNVIEIFNNINLKFDASNLSEDLLNHLKIEFKHLEEQAHRLWSIQQCRQTIEGQSEAKKLINDFHLNLIDFNKMIEPYLKKGEKRL